MTHNFHRLHPKKYACFCANAGHARLTRVLRRNIITRVRRLRLLHTCNNKCFSMTTKRRRRTNPISTQRAALHCGQNQTAVVRIIPASTHSYFAPSPCLSQQRFFIGSGARRDLALTQKRNICPLSRFPRPKISSCFTRLHASCMYNQREKSVSAGFASVCGETLQRETRETAKMAVF